MTARLCELLEKFKGGPLEKRLNVLRHPPDFADCKPHLEAYISKIREFQELVREYGCEIRLEMTETDGVKYGHLFETNIHAVLNEFGNWGLPVYHCSSYANTGHLWVTVRTARFKSGYNSQEALDRMKAKKDELNESAKPINLFVDLMDDYEKALRGLGDFMTCREEYAVLYEARDRMDEAKKKFIAETVFTRKGILSLCFVSSLLYRLEQSLDLSQNHPGD